MSTLISTCRRSYNQCNLCTGLPRPAATAVTAIHLTTRRRTENAKSCHGSNKTTSPLQILFKLILIITTFVVSKLLSDLALSVYLGFSESCALGQLHSGLSRCVVMVYNKVRSPHSQTSHSWIILYFFFYKKYEMCLISTHH